MRRIIQGVEYDECVRCGKTFTSYELLYDGVEPDCHDPMCHWCIVKDAQERFGVENVRIPGISEN